jgi:hypothetical protein
MLLLRRPYDLEALVRRKQVVLAVFARVDLTQFT